MHGGAPVIAIIQRDPVVAVVLVLPLYVVGLALVISGYVMAFVRATMMVLGLGPSTDEDQSDANGLINANDLINADEHDVRCYGA